MSSFFKLYSSLFLYGAFLKRKILVLIIIYSKTFATNKLRKLVYNKDSNSNNTSANASNNSSISSQVKTDKLNKSK